MLNNIETRTRNSSDMSCCSDFASAVSWVKERGMGNASVAILQYYASDATTYSLDQLKDTPWGIVPEFPVIVAQRGPNEFAMAVSESSGSLQPVNSHKSIIGYRFDRVESFRSIIEHGFYQIPGRLCFRKRPELPDSADSYLLTAYRLPSSWIANTVIKFDRALAYMPERMGATLPTSIAYAIGGYEETAAKRQDSRNLALKMGEKYGFLIHVPPSYIDMEETYKVSRYSSKSVWEQIKDVFE